MAKMRLFLRDDGPIGGFVAIIKAENGTTRRLLHLGQYNFGSKAHARKAFEEFARTRAGKAWAAENKWETA